MSPKGGQPVRVAGICPVCGGDTATASGVYCATHQDPSSRPEKVAWFTRQEEAIPAPATTPFEPERPAGLEELDGDAAPETAPSSPYANGSPPASGSPPIPDAGGASRWRRALGLGPKKEKPAKEPKAPKAPAPPRPPRGKRRISGAGDFAEMYGEIGARLSLTPQYPLGRLMTYQAPAAGVIIDNAFADTFVDRLAIQPMLRQKEKWEPLADLVMSNLLTVQLTNATRAGDTQKANVYGSMLVYVIHRNLRSLAPGAQEARARAAEEDALIGEAFPELYGLEDEATGRPLSPAEVLVASLLAPPPEAGVAPQPEDQERPEYGEALRTNLVPDS